MSAQLAKTSKLSTLDLIFCAIDSPCAPLDFTVILHLAKMPALDSLRKGARSARNRYPTTGSYIDKNRWGRSAELKDGVEMISAVTGQTQTQAIEAFVAESVDLHKQMPVQQLVIVNGVEVKLVTRFHHAVADGLSAAMWLGHQLRVAYGYEAPLPNASLFEEIDLRKPLPATVQSDFADGGSSQPLWTPGLRRSGARRWLTIDIPSADLRERCRRNRGFTYNDLLITCALETLSRWNATHGVDGGRIGIWLPINIRQQSQVGFGNGTSRIRLRARYGGTARFADKCREVRQQVAWATRSREWVVPEATSLMSLPHWFVNPILRRYLNRPSVDMATAVFSHAERWAGDNAELFRHVEKIECIGPLPRQHGLAFYGATHRGKTWLTLTYDAGLFFSAEIEELAKIYREQITLAQQELI